MHSPRPHGLSIKGGGELTAKDRTYVDAVVRNFLNFKETSNLESLRMCYDLPDGGIFIVQYMGGIFRVIIDKSPTTTEAAEDIEQLEIPMLFCGGISSDAISSEEALALKISSLTQQRLVGYSEDAELPEQDISLKRFNISVNTEVVPEFERASTQYQLQRPTWYSGAMAEVMQIVGGYGKQPKTDDESGSGADQSEYETIQFTLPETLAKDINRKLMGVGLPGYTGKPNEDGQFQYDYKFSQTHAVGFDVDNYPWLMQVSNKGVFAMPLPIVPATATDQFRSYINNKGDTELLAILDRFGALPSGESFPVVEDEFEAWRRAGVIIKLCDMDEFYEKNAYSESCGWSFNSKGTIGFNTCYNVENGYNVGYAYRLEISLQTSEYTRGWINKVSVPSESVEAVSTYLSKLIPLLDDSAKSLAIKYKLRRSLENVIARASTGSADSSEVDYWDNLELEAISIHTASLVSAGEGYLYYNNSYQTEGENSSSVLAEEKASESNNNSKTLIQYLMDNLRGVNKTNSPPILRFPNPSVDYSFDEFSFASNNQDPQSCDTIVFGYFIGDDLKVVKYFLDWDAYKKDTLDGLKSTMITGTFERAITSAPTTAQGYFYTTDLDLRDDTYLYKYTKTYDGTHTGTSGVYFVSGYIYKDEMWQQKYTFKLTSRRCLDISLIIPYFSRNNCLIATEEFKPLETSCYWTNDQTEHQRYYYGMRMVAANEWRIIEEVDMSINNPSIIGTILDKPSWQSVGAIFDTSNLVTKPPYGTTVLTYDEPQTTSLKAATLYGTPLSDALLIADTTNRNSYFSTDAYLDGCKVVFGTQQYANIGLSTTADDRQSWGSTIFSDGTTAQHFIGVINE